MLPKLSLRASLISIAALLLAALPMGLTLARSAQPQATGELLTNPGFEDPFIQVGTADIFVANGWSAWYITPDGVNFPSECPNNAPATCVPYRIPIYHNSQPQDPKAPERARSGNSQQWGISYAVYIAGVYQHVPNITPGTPLRFSAFMQGFNCSDNRGCYGPAGEYAHSYEPGDMHMRIGIDPNGGTDPFGANVVWSGYQNPLDAFGLIQVEAVAQANSVTVFLWSAPNFPELHTDIYVDDASLTVAGQGAVTPPAQPAGTAQPIGTAQPVPTVPSGPGTYTVQSGDSLFAIALANNLTLDQLLALNPGLSRDSILQIGQVIKTGGAASGSTPAPQPTSAPTTAPTSAPAAASSTPGGPTTYVVKSGDTLSAIALEFNLTVDQLLSLSGIAKDTPLQVGQVLTVGVAAVTPTPTATAAPTSAVPLPTPTPAVSTSGLCLLAFDDQSGNSTYTGSEALVTGVKFEVKSSDGKSVATYTSDGQQEPHCLSNLPDGRYTVDVTLSAERQATTEIHWSLSLLSGTSVNVYIGSKAAPVATAIPEVTAAPEAVATNQGGGGAFALIAGAALIAIAGIALFIGLRSRKK
jgi:LysM repeat protein